MCVCVGSLVRDDDDEKRLSNSSLPHEGSNYDDRTMKSDDQCHANIPQQSTLFGD